MESMKKKRNINVMKLWHRKLMALYTQKEYIIFGLISGSICS